MKLDEEKNKISKPKYEIKQSSGRSRNNYDNKSNFENKDKVSEKDKVFHNRQGDRRNISCFRCGLASHICQNRKQRKRLVQYVDVVCKLYFISILILKFRLFFLL